MNSQFFFGAEIEPINWQIFRAGLVQSTRRQIVDVNKSNWVNLLRQSKSQRSVFVSAERALCQSRVNAAKIHLCRFQLEKLENLSQEWAERESTAISTKEPNICSRNCNHRQKTMVRVGRNFMAKDLHQCSNIKRMLDAHSTPPVDQFSLARNILQYFSLLCFFRHSTSYSRRESLQ